MQCIAVSLSSSIHTFGRLIVSLYVSNACTIMRTFKILRDDAYKLQRERHPALLLSCPKKLTTTVFKNLMGKVAASCINAKRPDYRVAV